MRCVRCSSPRTGAVTRKAAPISVCLDCNRRISRKRLEFDPNARYCVVCQEGHDARVTADSRGVVLAAVSEADCAEHFPTRYEVNT
jgi:hypothetical protein